MPYKLDPARPLPEALRSVAVERLSDARHQLVDRPAAFGECVHEARKRMKETRAVLRLVRGELGKKRYRSENGRLRDAARRLAPLRDTEVAGATLEQLVGTDDRYDAVREAFARESRAHRARLSGPGQLAPVVDALDGALDDVRAWDFCDDWSTVTGGLVRIYRQGRDRLAGVVAPDATVDDEDADVALHELRKAVKGHWYHLRLLRPAWPAYLKAVAGRADTVAEALGVHQDVVVLDRILTGGEVPIDDQALGELRVRMADRRADLRAAALAECRRLYAARPKVLGAYLGDLWAAARPSST